MSDATAISAQNNNIICVQETENENITESKSLVLYRPYFAL